MSAWPGCLQSLDRLFWNFAVEQPLGPLVRIPGCQPFHYVEIPAVQSQQQSPSVENANKKKVHM